MKKLSNLCCILAVFTFVSSCHDTACTNINPTFNRYTPGTKDYKSELARQIQTAGAENITYWFEDYLVKGGKEYIVLNIRGARFCAKGEIEVNDWSKIRSLRREVSGYRGAELKGFKMKINEDTTGATFVYEDIAGLID